MASKRPRPCALSAVEATALLFAADLANEDSESSENEEEPESDSELSGVESDNTNSISEANATNAVPAQTTSRPSVAARSRSRGSRRGNGRRSSPEPRMWENTASTTDSDHTNDIFFSPNEFPGPQLAELPGECANELDYFSCLFSEHIVEKIVVNINDFAKKVVQQHTPLQPKSRFSNWKETTATELKRFFCVSMNMGINPKPNIRDYWRTDEPNYCPWFASMFSRDRFEILYHSMMHVSEVDVESKEKITEFVKISVSQFQHFFYPYQNVSVDEITIGFKGRIKYKQYNPNKPNKWHIKFFAVCDSATGYTWNLLPYFGSDTEYLHTTTDFPFTERVVHELVAPLGEGHHVFGDRYYSSVALAKSLKTDQLYYTGTVNKQRVGLPPELKTLKLQQWDTAEWRSTDDQLLLSAWRDKKAKVPVFLVSSYFSAGSEKVTRKSGKEVVMPCVVKHYNVNMGGVDLSDQFSAYYALTKRRQIKWWKKVFWHIFELYIINAFILMCLATKKPMRLLEFKRALIKQLSEKSLEHEMAEGHEEHEPAPKKGRQSKTLTKVRLQNTRHLISYEEKYTRDCRVCSNRAAGQRRETRFFCKNCPDKPHLHPKECFERFHEAVNYKS